jgi:hypothetical protein
MVGFSFLANVRFSNRALMSSYQCLWHSVGRVLAWVTPLQNKKFRFAPDSGHSASIVAKGRY